MGALRATVAGYAADRRWRARRIQAVLDSALYSAAGCDEHSEQAVCPPPCPTAAPSKKLRHR